jgi:hypothetical protein
MKIDNGSNGAEYRNGQKLWCALTRVWMPLVSYHFIVRHLSDMLAAMLNDKKFLFFV